MGEEEYVLARKIQLLINSDSKEERKNVWDTLYQWRYMCFKAANFIASHCYLQDQIKEMIYLTEGVKAKLSDMRKDPLGIFTTSGISTTYQMLSGKFKGEIPMQIIGALNNNIVSIINKERIAVVKGEKSVRNYKRTIPIPFPATALRKIKLSENGKFYTFVLYGLSFSTYFGVGENSSREMWDRAMNGNYKLCTSSIVMDKGKIFLLARFRIEKKEAITSKYVVAELSLSIEIPMILTIGKARYEIGNKEEYLHRRLAIQHARRRIQSGASTNRSAHGKKRKLKPVINFGDKERNYIDTKLHTYTRQVIDICVKNGVSALMLVDQQEKEQIAKGNPFILSNWGYYSLKEKLGYKAKIAGITIVSE